MVWTILGAEGSKPQRCSAWGRGDRSRGVLPWGLAEGNGDGGGKDSKVWGSPQRRTPTMGETRKGGSTLSPLLGSQQPLPQQAGLSDHREGSFRPTTYSFQPQGLPRSGKAP